MSDDDLCFAGVAQLAMWLRERRVSPVEVVEALLGRIGRLNERLRAYITVDADGARARARCAEAEIAAGRYRGPLHGVPVAYKDIIDVRGMPTTAGSRLTDRSPATRDAAVAARLGRAGAVAIGKLNTTEFAAGTMEVFGEARNPWDISRTTGGSSAGAGAALAAGLATLAIGTDTGGSIRIPASYCGVTGFKPTFGLIEGDGVVPFSASFDCPGPMARSVPDLAIALDEMAPPRVHDARCSDRLTNDLRGTVLALPHPFFDQGLDADVAGAVDRFVDVARSLGASVLDVDVPLAEMSGAAFSAIAYSEAFAYHRENVRTRFAEFTRPFAERLVAAACLSAADLRTAHAVREALAVCFTHAFRGVDALVVPTTPTAATAIGRTADRADRNRFTRPANVIGGPAVAVPCGFNHGGLPLSVQLMGPPGADERLLRIALVCEGVVAVGARPPCAPADVPPTEEPMDALAGAVADVAHEDVGAVERVAASLGVALDERAVYRVAAQWAACRDALDEARSRLSLNG